MARPLCESSVHKWLGKGGPRLHDGKSDWLQDNEGLTATDDYKDI